MAAVGALGFVVPPDIHEAAANRVNPLDEKPAGLARVSDRDHLSGTQSKGGYDE